jgi:hypothetical protein
MVSDEASQLYRGGYRSSVHADHHLTELAQ